MFPGAVEAEPMAAGSCSVAAPAGTDQLDLEAAEQLIQLSGGDNGAAGDADDAGSESRSADSVKCGSKEKEKEKEAAVVAESRRRRSARRVVPAAGKEGNGGGESDIKRVVDSSAACSATAADVMEKEEELEEEKVAVVESCRRTAAAERFPAGKKKDRDGGVVHGEARKRPRYRLLADIYRDTEPTRLTAAGGEGGHADRDPPEGVKRKKEKKRAADGVVAVDAEASKARRSAQLAHTRM